MDVKVMFLEGYVWLWGESEVELSRYVYAIWGGEVFTNLRYAFYDVKLL